MKEGTQMQLLRRITLSSPLILVVLLSITMQMSVAAARPLNTSSNKIAQSVSSSIQNRNPDVELLRQMVRDGRLAPTVRVLNSMAPTTIVQFPLLPSGIKNAFPQATGLVTIVRGNRDNAFSDTITVDVQKMPPNTTFTIFYIQFAGKPFGNVEYVADLTTRGDGSGETIFQNIALVAMAMDA